eukprot:TRINITY_DN801_c0_g2_i1.p1 TRINITY_DN801_c0_g2~~TRINITY_DN801_c0_g2_i1.p1  ORF type:complete len:180 (+),score=13.88 TRINITY_DN801_c0_g2_i1:146-685(+)
MPEQRVGSFVKNVVIYGILPGLVALSAGIFFMIYSASGITGKCFTRVGITARRIDVKKEDMQECYITNVTFIHSDKREEPCGRFYNGLGCATPLARFAQRHKMECQLSSSPTDGNVCQGGDSSSLGSLIGLMLCIFGSYWLTFGLIARCYQAAPVASFIKKQNDDVAPSESGGKILERE